jgi:hypothetical protein
MIPLIPTVGVMVNSIWGYHLTSSNLTPTASNIPGWSNASERWDSWQNPTLAPNGHMYAAPGTATCVLKIFSGSQNSGSLTNYSPSTIQFITTSKDGGDFFLPGSNGNPRVYEKFSSLILASNGRLYAPDYGFLPGGSATTTGYILEVNPTTDTYTTYSFQYPDGVGVRSSTPVLGIDGYIYWMLASSTSTSFMVYRFNPLTPSTVQSSSILASLGGSTPRSDYSIGNLASNGRIYFIPRYPSAITKAAICVSSSLFSGGTLNGITKVAIPTELQVSTNPDIPYWSRGVGLDGCTYFSPRYLSYGTVDVANIKTLKLDPNGGASGTGSFSLVGPPMTPSATLPYKNISQGYAKTINGDLFSIPLSSWNTSFTIVPSGSSPTVISSSQYPIAMSNTNNRTSAFSTFVNGKMIGKQPVSNNNNEKYNIFYYELFSVKGYYSGVTNFNVKDTNLFIPPSPISTLSGSRYNWHSNNGL